MRDIDTARHAHRNLRRVCHALEQPSVHAWDVAAAELNAAIEYVTALESSLKSSTARPAGLAAEISAIRRDIANAQALLASAGRFYQGLARLMQDQDTESVLDYTARGKPAAGLATVPPKVVLHG